MTRLVRLIDLMKEALSDVSIAWRGEKYRKSVVIAGAVLLATWLFAGLPFSAGRPIVDAAALATRTASAMLDALGVIHYLGEGQLSIVLPGLAIDARGVSELPGLATLTVTLCLVWVAWANASVRRAGGMSVGAIGATHVANVLTLFFVGLAGEALGLDATRGSGWLLTIAARILLSAGLLFCLIHAVDLATAVYRFRRSVKHPDSSGELPVPVTIKRRREILIAAAMLLVALGLWLAGRAITRETLVTTYRDVAERGLNAGDLSMASVALQRLAQLDASALPHRFLRALLHEAEGDTETAERLIRELVDGGHPRYPPAHRWLADRIARQRTHLAGGETDTAEQPVSHLASAAAFDPTNVNAHIALAEAYLARRSPQQAIRELERIVDSRPDLRLTLAQLAVISGRRDSARIHGKLAREFYEDELASLPLAVEPRLRLAASLLFLEDFSKAAAVLLKGWEQSQDAVYQQALGTCYLVWHDVQAGQGATREERLSLLEKSLSYAPDHPETLKRIALMATEEQRTGPAIELLTRALADRPIPADVHFVLGTNAYRHGRLQNALRHLEEAYRLNPKNVETLNNLALILSEADSSQLERALELADAAVRRNPHLASLRETRGQILARMGRWSRAVADLENALQVMRGHSGIHGTLAQAYAALGDDQLASEHRRLSGQDHPGP